MTQTVEKPRAARDPTKPNHGSPRGRKKGKANRDAIPTSVAPCPRSSRRASKQATPIALAPDSYSAGSAIDNTESRCSPPDLPDNKPCQANRTAEPIGFPLGTDEIEDGEVANNPPEPTAEALPSVPMLRELQARRVVCIRAILALTNQATALLARSLGYGANLEEKDRKKLWGEAAKARDAIEDGTPATAISPGIINLVMSLREGRRPLEANRKDIEAKMVELAISLPVWPWVEAVRGLGALGLAIIIGEAGDLGMYVKGPAGIWKRLGLAPKSAYRDVTKAGEECYKIPRRRRSAMWTIGDSLLKGNRDGPYRTLYLTRKQYEHDRDADMTKMHAHRRAQRYMEKRLILDLWKAWKQSMG